MPKPKIFFLIPLFSTTLTDLTSLLLSLIESYPLHSLCYNFWLKFLFFISIHNCNSLQTTLSASFLVLFQCFSHQSEVLNSQYDPTTSSMAFTAHEIKFTFSGRHPKASCPGPFPVISVAPPPYDLTIAILEYKCSWKSLGSMFEWSIFHPLILPG